jgi:two-component system, LytTR family, response regulator LytT
MKIVIIEDEKLTAKDLARTILAVDEEIEISKTLHSVEEAKEYFDHKPEVDLIFSDIQLGDGLSFDIFEHSTISAPIVFCTAYNEYALRAFSTVGLDYILKPFSKQSVAASLEKYQKLKEHMSAKVESKPEILNLLKAQLFPQKKIGSIIVQKGDKIIPIEAEQIALLYIENESVYARLFDGSSLNINQKLDKLEEQLSPQFFRANRQILVNRKAVKNASHHFNRKIEVHLEIPFSEQILIGKLKITAFLEWLSEN